MMRILHILLIATVCLQANESNGKVVRGSLNTILYRLESREFDLDQDGLSDILVSSKKGQQGYYLTVVGLNGAKVEKNATGGLKAYYAGDLTGSGNYGDDAIASPIDFPDLDWRYMGLKIMVGGQLCCTYLRIWCSDRIFAGDFSLEDYGYETNSALCVTVPSLSPNSVTTVHATARPRIVPNPCNGTANILPGKSGHYQVAIVNIFGQTVLFKSFEVAEADKNRPILLTDLKSGAYVVNIASDVGLSSLPIIVKE